MGIPRRDRRTGSTWLTGSAMGWHADGSDVTKIVPQRGNDAFGPVRQARAQQTRCVSGATHGGSVSSSSHPRPRLHIGYGRSPCGETPRSVRGQRCASQPPTQEHTSSDRHCARARTRRRARSAQRRGTTSRSARSASRRHAAQRSDRAGIETELNSQRANARWTVKRKGTWENAMRENNLQNRWGIKDTQELPQSA